MKVLISLRICCAIDGNFSIERAKFARTGQWIGMGLMEAWAYNQTQSNPLTEARKCGTLNRVVISVISVISVCFYSENVHFTEELGTMEVWRGGADGTPADEVRDGQKVATFIDISLDRTTIQTGDVMTEEDGVGDAQSQFPAGRLFLGVERRTAQR